MIHCWLSGFSPTAAYSYIEACAKPPMRHKNNFFILNFYFLIHPIQTPPIPTCSKVRTIWALQVSYTHSLRAVHQIHRV